MSFLSITALVCTLLFSLFLLLKFRSKDIVPPALLLILAVVLHALEAYLLANPEQFFLKQYILFLEGCLPLSAIGYSVYFCRAIEFRRLSLASRLLLPLALLYALGSFFLSPEQLYFSPDFGEEKILFLTNSGFLFYLILMIFMVLSMIQLERTMSALSQHERWRVKFEIIAFCVLLGTYVVYFSQSLLYRSLDMGLLDARSFALLLTSGLLCYSRVYRSRGEQIHVSRGAAYRSMILFAVGAYLIGLGLLGEGMKYLDFPAQRTFLLALAMVSAVIVSALFLSENLRRRVKVYLHKNFRQTKYDYRQHWQVFTERISTAASLADLQQEILVFFCETFACKGAALYQLDPEENCFTNSAYFEFRRDWRSFTHDDPLIGLFAERDWIVNLQEDNPALADSLSESLAEAEASFIIPLLFDNELKGFVVLAGQINSNEVLTYEDFDLMRMLARQSIATLQGISLAEQLATSRELAAIGKVSTFVLHDLKNQVSGLSLMLDNACDYIDDPEFQQDMLETVGNTVSNMKGLIGRLKNLKEKPQLITAPVDLSKVVMDAFETSGGNVQISGETTRIDADEEEIYKVVLNLLLNAREATRENLPVSIDYGYDQESAFIRVVDQGCGMSGEFIAQRLFKPFETTKKHGFGIGLYQCKQIVESHHGTITVESREGEGTTFSLLLPLAPDMVSE